MTLFKKIIKMIKSPFNGRFKTIQYIKIYKYLSSLNLLQQKCIAKAFVESLAFFGCKTYAQCFISTPL